MHLFASRLCLAAVLALGLSASAAWAGGRGSGGQGSPCGGHCQSSKAACSPCDKPRPGCGHDCASGCPAYGCPAEPGCDENCCDENCCDEDCSCDDACRSRTRGGHGDYRCKDGDGDDEGDDADDEDCDDDGGQIVDNADCCDGWFFGNWFKGWNASSSQFNHANKSCSPGMKCEKFNAAAKFPYKLGEIYGGAMGRPTGNNAVGHGASGYGASCGHPYGVMQTGANSCGCKCDCGKCKCGNDRQTACQAGGTCPAECGTTCGPMCPPYGVSTSNGCPLGFCGPPHPGAPCFTAPLPPPPPAPPGCPVMGPHGEVFHRLAGMMAENAALQARLQAKEDWADEQECLRAALSEAREENARLTAAQQNGSSKDQVLVEWIKAQSEASARKDEMLTEVLGAVMEMNAAKSEVSASEKLEAKIEKLETALEQMKEENAKLKTRVSHLKRESKRVSTSGDGTSCNHHGGCHGELPVYKVQTEPVDCPIECPAECPR